MPAWLWDPWTAACQDSMPLIISWSSPKFMSIESVMLSNHLIFCHPLLLLLQFFPASGSFPVSQFFSSSAQSIGASASASVLPVSIQGRFSLGLTGWISLQSKGPSRVSSPAPQFKSINSSMLSLLYGPTLISICGYWKNHSFYYMALCQQSDVFTF